MWIISSALGEWHSAIFSTVPERESRPQRQFSACSRFVNHERITAQTSCGSSTPGQHDRGWAQLNWERNESVHEVIPFTSFTEKIHSFEWHVRDRHNTNLFLHRPDYFEGHSLVACPFADNSSPHVHIRLLAGLLPPSTRQPWVNREASSGCFSRVFLWFLQTSFTPDVFSIQVDTYVFTAANVCNAVTVMIHDS